jgi:hypothetical protein
MLVDEYRRRYERPSDHEMRPLTPLARERERKPRGPLLPPWAVIGVVLVAVVVVLAIIGSGGSSNKTPSPTGTRANKPKRHRPARKHHHSAAVAKAKTAKLQLTPTGTVYVCLVDQGGKKLINQQTFSAGQTIPVQSGPKLYLTLGNASVQMKINGKTVPVAPSASAIRMLVTPSGAHPIPLSTTPTCP